MQNYPNPFNPSTTIEYAINKKEFVSLRVFDIVGRELANLVNEVREPGFYKLDFDASKLTSGIYFYQLRTDSYLQTRKMQVLK